MHKGTRIIAFIAVFLIIATMPFLANHGQASADPEVSLDTPAVNEMPVKQCIEPLQDMRSEHMQILDSWRDRVVREGQTTYVNSVGQPYEMSLDETCLSCHSNREQFCDSCHSYSGVDVYCWSCHDGASNNSNGGVE
ncbi:MAG: sulfate reduction electron transfer complex DsrMKJOP subunit DsrJ [Actinomycetia bacterium]|nr:sulfate reduction electron transfer complex DsrMKJOP subunit DsrJ [Actinomycetes bacterium]